ncbi:MAG: lamin tail domain-containing protein [Bacteroidales bacterium]|nr:lamin tail domain-containing protein [Bacteroidales bacterium]
MLSPNGGEWWEQNTTHDITWYNQNFTDNVKIELTGTNAQVLETSYVNTGTYQWNIPAGQPIASDYTVKISSATLGTPFDESDNTFSIVAQGSIPQPNDIIITEIMQNPQAVLDSHGEWFEVFNTTDSDIDMYNWTIKDDDYDSHIIDTILIVPAHGFAVLGIDADTATNGSYICNYQYNNFYLGNGSDEVVLVSPDGVTEIDRVNYDGGTTFPDPTGKSMVFTGIPTDDNNNGANWVEATLRELNYYYSTGDLGSPGTNGHDQNLLTLGITVNLTVFLEGTYNPLLDGAMETHLLTNGYLPLTQPYNPILPYYGNLNPVWLYAGTENVAAIPANVVDWVMVELRDAPDAASATSATIIAQKALFVLSNGSVVDLDGTTVPNFGALIMTDGLFAVIYHRNHLAVINPDPLVDLGGGNYAHSFTTGLNYGGALGQTEVEAGVWAMFSSDGNADKQVSNADKLDVWETDSGGSGYKGGDFSLNGQCNNQDKVDYWSHNTGAGSQVPN